jgi:HSP20 family molecular chaperone IbpA
MEGADFSLSIEGRRLTVAVRWQTSRRRVSRGAEAKSESEETTRQSFLLPADADLSSLEARIETGVLRIRLRLRRQER